MVSPDDVIARSPRIAQRLFEERMLVITVDDSKLHRFNEVATFIWQQLDTPKKIGDICALVAGHFDCAGGDAIEKDIHAFVEVLVRKGLLVLTAAAHERR